MVKRKKSGPAKPRSSVSAPVAAAATASPPAIAPAAEPVAPAPVPVVAATPVPQTTLATAPVPPRKPAAKKPTRKKPDRVVRRLSKPEVQKELLSIMAKTGGHADTTVPAHGNHATAHVEPA